MHGPMGHWPKYNGSALAQLPCAYYTSINLGIIGIKSIKYNASMRGKIFGIPCQFDNLISL